MLRVLSTELWPTIAELASKAERKQAAVAYVTSDEKISFGKGDILITDASDESIAGGRTSAKVLAAAHKRGARLYSLAGLHAKVICLARFTAIGSANISALSADTLVEAAVVTDHPAVLAEARSLVAQLQAAATLIDAAFIKRVMSIPVMRASAPPVRRRPRVGDHASRTWLIGVHPLDEERYADEAERAEEGWREAAAQVESETSDVSWVRFTGTSRFRREAQPGDTVIQIWQRRAKAKSGLVYYPAPVVLRQDEPTCTRFFIEDFADEDARALPWKTFLGMWKSASDASPPPAGCARLLAPDIANRLLALWHS